MIPVVEQGAVDGVPVLRTGGVAGRHAAGLMFRVGQFDEALPDRGVTHMVEHLTLGGHHEATYHFNASVEGRYTQYVAESADPADIATYLRAVCAGLAADHGQVLERERRVLRTEAASRGGTGVLGRCLVERYGARGPGLLNYDEFGLERLGWADVAAWRARWFTSGNAALWVAGDLPDGLELSLARGYAQPSPDLAPQPLALPAYVTGAKGGIAAALVSDRSFAAHAALDILQRRLTQALRHDHGLTYDVGLDVQEVDSGHLHAWLTADALPEQVPMAAHVLLSTFETLATAGPREAELAAYRRRVADGLASPAGPAGLLQRHARAVLNGKPPRSAADSIRLAAEVSPQDVAKATQALRESMLVAAPYDVPAVQGRMGRVPSFSATAIGGGKAHKPATGDWPTLTVSDEGVMLTRAADEHVTVRYATAAALLRWNDGKQSLIGGDGFSVTLDPAQWKNGAAVVSAIAARLPGALAVPIDRPGPATAAPRPAEPPAAGPATERRASGPAARLARIVRNRTFLAASIAILFLGGIAWTASSGSASALSPVALGAIVLARVLLISRRRRR
ncbi:MAG TPA: insulinase family protein [Trebonia sp.]|nr:insulinase family protein [Trebonia sp.]